MGIFLNFTIAPFRISPTEWEKTYEDALQIADKSELLDRIIGERGGVQYGFVRKTSERDVWGSGLGFCVCGTMNSGLNMEDFPLFRSLDYYRNEFGEVSETADNGADILFSGWYTGSSDDAGITQPNLAYNIWGGKTQGEPGHIPLLAIACLFAGRFPDAVTVGGDITAGQCRTAVRLVKECLGIDIQTPANCRPDALAQRIHAADIPDHLKLRVFFELYMGTLTGKVGEILREVFGEDALYRYFRDEMTKANVENYSMSSDIKNYLLLGLDFAGLLRLLVSDKQGCRMSLETALSELFSYNIHVPLEEKDCTNPLPSAAEDGDSETPSSISGLMGGAFFMLAAGRNRNLPVYVPLEDIRTACRSFDHDSDALIDRLLQEQVPNEMQELAYGNGENSLMSMLRQAAEKDAAQEAERAKYDISDFPDLFEYTPGCTFEPEFEKDLLDCLDKVRGFDANREMFEEFLRLDQTGRETWFLQQNRYVLFREDVWEHIFEHIMEDEYIHHYFLLFLVDCSFKRCSELIEPLMSSPELVDMLWEKALIRSKAADLE